MLIHRVGAMGDTLSLGPLVEAAHEGGWEIHASGPSERWGLFPQKWISSIHRPDRIFDPDFLADPSPKTAPQPDSGIYGLGGLGFHCVLYFTSRPSRKTSPGFHLLAALPPPGQNAYEYAKETARQALGLNPRTSGPPQPPGLGWILAPGAGSQAKQRPLEEFLQAAEDHTPVPRFLLGPAEPLSWDRRIQDAGFPCHRPEAAQLPGLLGGARNFLGHDSGPAHLAARLGLETHIIYVSTQPVPWKPPGRVHSHQGKVPLLENLDD